MDTGRYTIKIKVLPAISAFLIWALLCPWTVKAGATDREIIPGDTVPVVTLEDTEGIQRRIPAEEGISVVLFWATWSPRSAPAIDLWEQFYSDYPDEPFRVVSVAAEKDELDQADVQAINTYVQERQVTLPVVVDEKLELFNSYGVKALPTVFMLNGSGLVLYRYSGLPSSAALELREELETRLGLRKPGTPEEKAARAGTEYSPANNALLFYRMGKAFEDKGLFDRAGEKYIEALQKDPGYEDPLNALERIYFREGITPEAREDLIARLSESGLGELGERVSETEPADVKVQEQHTAPQEEKPLTPMERMRLLMEKNKTSVQGSEE